MRRATLRVRLVHRRARHGLGGPEGRGVIRPLGFHAAQRPAEQVLRRFLGGQHVQYLEHFLNGRETRLHVPAHLAERRPVVGVMTAVSVAGAVGVDTRTGRRAVEQQINRPTVFVPKSESHKKLPQYVAGIYDVARTLTTSNLPDVTRDGRATGRWHER